MRWHLKTGFQGHRVEFGAGDNFVSVVPSQFGKIISVTSCGYIVCYIPIYDAVTAAVGRLPKPHRFGSTFSDARVKLCRAIIRELNRGGYKPMQQTASRPGDIPW